MGDKPVSLHSLRRSGVGDKPVGWGISPSPLHSLRRSGVGDKPVGWGDKPVSFALTQEE